jgi:RNA binding exosome subunit
MAKYLGRHYLRFAKQNATRTQLLPVNKDGVQEGSLSFGGWAHLSE